MVRDFRSRGMDAKQDPDTRSVLIRDKAGGEARVSPTPRGVEVVGGEGSRQSYSMGLGGRLDAFELGGTRFVLDHDEGGGLTAIRGPQGPLFKLESDPLGRLTAIQDPGGARTTYEYDDHGNMSGFRDRNRSKTELLRDDSGRLTGYVDPRGSATRFEYGERDVPESIALPSGDQWSFRFDDEGLLESMLVNGFEHAAYDIDPDSGDVSISYPDGTETILKTDGGRIVEATNEHCTVRFAYDNEGRLLAEESSEGKVTYERDAVGAIIAVVGPDGSRAGFERDRENRVHTAVDWHGGRHQIRYDARGALSAIHAPNGASTTQTSTDLGLPASLEVNSPGEPGGPTLIRSWSYDKNNRVVSEAAEFGRRKFQYDPEGRLTKAASTQAELQESWRVDPCGNKAFIGETQCRYGRMNEIVSHGDQPFAYDALGNMTRGSCDKGDTLFTYNRRNQLIAADTPTGSTRYAYDAIGRRIWKENGQTITRYVWAGTTLLREIRTSPHRSSRTDYLFLAGTPMPIAIRIDGHIHAVHAGRRMEPLCITDEQGHVVWRARYDAFGYAHVSVAKISQPLRLAGQTFDDETGLHYNVARYYNPKLGVFQSLDPLLGDGGSLNLYNYCDGDPLNCVDPNGEFVILAALAVVGAGIVIGAVVNAGIEWYKQGLNPTDPGKIAKAALVGGIAGGIGAAVGAAVVGSFSLAAMGTAALIGVGALSGGASAAAEYCVEAAANPGTFSGWGLVATMGIGAAIGAVTLGLGGKLAKGVGKLLKGRALLKEADEVAEAMLKKAAQEEKLTTPMLEKIAKKNGASMEGLEFRLKTKDSLARKLETDAIDSGKSISEVGDATGDSLRYTMVQDEKALAKTATDTFAELEEAGYKKLKVKNTWDQDSPYKGVNTVWESPSGQKLEVQFHTESSFKMKQETHGLYETARSSTATPAQQAEATQKMIGMSDSLKTPDDISSITNYP